MLHLTPQERFVISALLAIVLTGSIVHFALSRQLPAAQWVKTAQRPHQPKWPDINIADAGQLEKLPGVGPSTAQNIIKYRQAQGPFVRLEELRKVKGISAANFKKIAEAYASP